MKEILKSDKKKISKMYKNIARHHIDAFDFAMTTCLERACGHLLPFDYIVPENMEKVGFRKMTLWYDSFELGKPTHEDIELEHPEIYPVECRERGLTYAAPLFAIVSRKIDDEMVDHIRIKLGDIPVMVGSKFCNLRGLNEKELVKKGEDMSEFGGYFMVNGNEKVIRMLIVQKRNYPVVFTRQKFVGRGKDFTAYACSMRCVRDDLTAQTITLHYLSDGSISLRFLCQKQEFLVPIILILKALKHCTDREIYEKIVKGNFNQKQISDRVEAILAQGKDWNIYDCDQGKAIIGSRFRIVLPGVTNEMSDVDAGELFLSKYICIHTSNYTEKFDSICIMIDKLYAAVSDETELDNLDSVANHDVLLGGHLYLQILAEKLFD
jgi:DNA-directed RNA polymerase I subunit RPA2